MLFFKTNIHKAKRSTGAAFLLFVFIFSTIVPLFNTTTTSADPGSTCAVVDPTTNTCTSTPTVTTYADQSPETRATSFWYYNAIGECMGAVGAWNISKPDDVQSGKWFAWNANGSASGYYMRDTVAGIGTDGQVNCNEGQDSGDSVLQNAFKFWGINGTQLACGSGILVRANGTDCVNGNGDFTWKSSGSDIKTPILNYIQNSILDGVSQSSIPKEVAYVYNLGTFLKGCAYGVQPQTTKPGGNNVYEIKDKTGKTVWYIGTEPGNWGAQYRPNPNITKNCQDLVNDINTYSAAYQAWLFSHPNTPDQAAPTSTACAKDSSGSNCNTTPTCTPEGIGWIVCPIMTSIAGGVSALFNVVKSFLIFKSYTTDQSSGLYPAWSIMRNFANIAFVIAFMFIIYSQITSAGISNYGIKKMLPRLIIGAILVNVSYWICGVAVDLSNILGSSLNDLMITLQSSVVSHGVDVSWQNATATILAGTAVGGVAVVSGLAAAGSFGALLWMLVPIVLAALFAILIAVIILAGRQVLLIIFIVISPLAFVAYLLPNTNKWYKKWQDTFIMLLLMFPIIAVIFGGSQFASAIILASPNLTMTMVLLALAVQVIPLAITPLVIKFSGGVLGKFAGMVNNPKRGPFDAAKNWAKDRQELATKRGLDPRNQGWINKLGQRRDGNRRTRELKGKSYESAADAGWQERVAEDQTLQSLNNDITAQGSKASEAQKVQKERYLKALGDAENPELLKTASGLGGDKASDRIMAAVKSEEVSEIAKAIENVKLTADFPPGAEGIRQMGEELAEAIKGNDVVKTRAMNDLLMTSGQAGLGQWRKTMNKLDEDGVLKDRMDSESVVEMRRDLLGKHAGVKATAVDINTFGVSGGEKYTDANGNEKIRTLADIQTSAATYKMADEDFVHQKPSTMELALKAHAISKEQAQRISSNPDLSKFIESESVRADLQKIAGTVFSSTSSVPLTTGASQAQQSSQSFVVPHNQPSSPPVNPNTSRATPPQGTSNYTVGDGGLALPPEERQ